MRFNIRFLAYLAVATTTCSMLLFLALSNAPAALHEHLQSFKATHGWSTTTSTATTTIADDISILPVEPEVTIDDLWRHWRKILDDAHPFADDIRIHSHAGNVAVEENPGFRTPDQNRVTNPAEDIEGLRTAHENFVWALQSSSWEQDSRRVFKGAGIVIVGGGEYFGPAIVSVQMLRKTGCTLPVEIFVADADEYEKEVCDDYLPTLGAKCLVLGDLIKKGKQPRANGKRAVKRASGGWPKAKTKPKIPLGRFESVTHYQLKSLAMLFSSFADVLYIDSDSIPLVNPTLDLFASAPYNTTGLVIWPDFWIASESPSFWSIAGLDEFPDGLPKSSSEAGQLLINKHTHLKTLLLANYYNIYGPDYYYPLLSQGALGQGDKETFLAAAVALNETWYRVRSPVTSTGRTVNGAFKGSGMIQYHPGDDLAASHARDVATSSPLPVRPAFIHANTPKMNAGHLVDEGDLVDGKGAHLRLWGDKATQQEQFGVDLEKKVWEIVVSTGCELQSVIKEWKKRENVCERLKEHFTDIFGETSIVSGGHTTRWRKKPENGE